MRQSVSLCLFQKSTFPQRKPSSRPRRPLSKASGLGFLLAFGLLQEVLSEMLLRRLKDGGAELFRIFSSLFRVSAKKAFPRLPEGFFCVAFYDKRGIQLLLPDVLIEFCGPAEKFHDLSEELIWQRLRHCGRDKSHGLLRSAAAFAIHNSYSHSGLSPCMLISVVLSDAGTAARVNTAPVPAPDRDLKN